MRLIDADDLKKTYYRELNIEPGETGACYIAFGMFPRMIDNAKTINIEKARLGTGDLISRRKALEALTVTEEMGTAELLWLLTTRINDLPTMSAEPKRGRWKRRHDKNWSGGGATYCSACGYGYAWDAFFEVENFNYCPNCGARMGASDD